MPRSRVLSFMSQWGAPPRSPTSSSFQDTQAPQSPALNNDPYRESTFPSQRPQTPTGPTSHYDRPISSASPMKRERAASRNGSRPASMVQTYQPPVMEVAGDTLPELMPIFTFLNSHSNKLYQEGYFLKLHDLDTRGRPSGDRTWTECFAQLVGTVLSLWDAAQLDIAGEDGEVVPSFINLADASIKMIEKLPMNGRDGQSLNNVLSISTAANNRYLFHFNSLNSLTQWTAGIRLAMYEHATLQEAYTGSLIAGKGKGLNNIKTIMDRTRMPQADWARVRFGAGTPWRRCWCVITPPDEKEYQKLQKTLKKQQNLYTRSMPVLKGTVKFYEAKKITKKTQPIATISDAYSAYAIYPQSKPLIDQSTLVKLECKITVHSNPESVTEGFVFIMPEVHPAVSGFEMMLRFLFPVWDVFNLYGRPNRLIADVLDTRGLMFAMPKDRRYGYLELLDVATLIHTDGSHEWTERRWRKELKNLTSIRMSAAMERGSGNNSRTSSRRATASQTSLVGSPRGVRFDGDHSAHSQPSTRRTSPVSNMQPDRPTKRVDSAPPGTYAAHQLGHHRSISETSGFRRSADHHRSGLSNELYGHSPYPSTPPRAQSDIYKDDALVNVAPDGFYSSDSSEHATPEHEKDHKLLPEVQALASPLPPPAPVMAPPTMHHAPSQKPASIPNHMPELRRAHSAIDEATIEQLADSNQAHAPGALAAAGAVAAWKKSPMPYDARSGSRSSNEYGRPSSASRERNPNQSSQYDYEGASSAPRGRPVENYGYQQQQQQYSSPQYNQAPYQQSPYHSQPYQQPQYQQFTPYQPPSSQAADHARSHSGNRGTPTLQVNPRLPTIPASPYVDQLSAESARPSYFEPGAPPVPEHAEPTDEDENVAPPPPPPVPKHIEPMAKSPSPMPPPASKPLPSMPPPPVPKHASQPSVELPYRSLDASESPTWAQHQQQMQQMQMGYGSPVGGAGGQGFEGGISRPQMASHGSTGSVNSIQRKPVGGSSVVR